MLIALGVLAAAAAAALIAALLVPLRIDLDLDVGPDGREPPMRVEVRWSRFAWHSDGHGTGPADRRGPVAPPRPRRRRRRVAIGAALRTPGFVSRCLQLAHDSFRVLRPRAAVVRARVGLDDPADTGMLAGALAASSHFLCRDGVDVRIVPDFSTEILAGRAHLSWALRPALVVWPIVTFATSPVVWRAARAVWRARGTSAAR